jgi:PAS domain S-box-containing protein
MSTHIFHPVKEKLLSVGFFLRIQIQKNLQTIYKLPHFPIEKYFCQILRSIKGVPAIVLDTDGTILTWNKNSEQLKGYKDKEIIGQNFSIFYLPRERQQKFPEELLRLAADRGKATHFSKRVRKDGTTFLGKITLTAIRNENNEVIGYTEYTMAMPEPETD